MAKLDTVRWGIIGAGNVAEFKSGPALYQTPGSELVAVMRRDPNKARDYARRHGARRWYGTAEELAADPQVNAVYIASPHDLHPAHVRLVADAGKAILCEKPIGVNAAQAQAAIGYARAQGVSLTVAYYRRFWPVTEAIQRLLREGAVGKVVEARVQLSDDFIPDADRPWITSEARSGGGALANAGSHWIDLVRLLLGEIAEVSASWSHDLGLEVEDGIQMDLRSVSGVPVAVNITLRSPIGVNEIDLYGTEGRILASPFSDGKLALFRRGHEPEAMSFPRQGAMHGYLLAALVPRLLAGEPSPLPGEEAVACWRVMEAAYESCRTGKRVQMGGEQLTEGGLLAPGF